jgi:putative esterase
VRPLVTLVMSVVSVGVFSGAEPQLKTASQHAMQYYVSLPDDWTPHKTWPVLITIEGSGKDFLDMARLYNRARQEIPFIVVSPIVLTNGGTNLRHSPQYNYASEVWDEVDRTGRCKFDLYGLTGVINDVRRRYNGETPVFITGFSAGAHAMWAMVFKHPELFVAAAPASGNYAGRCMDDGRFSMSHNRAQLPIKGFLGGDEIGRGLDLQFARAREEGRSHGYASISLEVVDGDHDPHAAAVLKWFTTIAKASRYIDPSLRLGRGVLGTLLFGRRSSEKLIHRGYLDAYRALHPYGL